MQQNIKVDVIYYLSPSDFEMEFNLCGCCHMRLLNEKTKDRKELVKALAKAVSRSKIIIACGPMFDDNGLINTISTAIGKGTEVINNADYGINFDDKISIIEGSTPLVTPEGFFGGCIIESGPQAIIILSESKGIRKSIMNNLIHQYIYELSLLPEDAFTRADENAEPEQEIAPEQTENISEETAEQPETEEVTEQETNEPQEVSSNAEQEIDENLVEETDVTEEAKESEEVEEVILEQTESEPVFEEQSEEQAEEQSEEQAEESETETEETQEETEEANQETEEIKEETKQDNNPFLGQMAPIEMYIDPKHISPKKVSDYAKNYVPSEKDKLFALEEYDEYDYDIDDDDEGFKPIPKGKLSIILILILLSLIIVVLLYLMVYIPYSKGIDYTSYIEQIFGEASNI